MADKDIHGTFTVDPGALGDAVQPILARRVASLTRQIAAQAKMNVPVKTGNLGRSIQEDNLRVTGPFRVEGGVTATANYAAAVHDGSGPYVIRPKKGKFLKFPGRDGRDVFVRQVRHPGSRPRPFLKNAAHTVISRMQ